MLDGVPGELLVLLGMIVGAGFGYLGTRRSTDTTLKIAREQLEAEHRVTDQASVAIRELLARPEWELRSFDAIRKRVRGFSDDELRKLLVACGAVAFDEEDSGRELWGLRERNSAKL